MYQPQYIRYVNFPSVPEELIAQFDTKKLIDSYYQDVRENKRTAHLYETYIWTDKANKDLNEWGQKNICPDMYYAFQLINGHLPLHKDNGTKTKLNYVIQTGGDNVVTEFYADDKTTKLASYSIPDRQWHIFKADTYHSVTNIQPGQLRFSITARIFE